MGSNAKEIGLYNFVMVGSHIATIAGALLIGYGANSWCIAAGVYLSLVCVSERIEMSIRRATTKATNFDAPI